MGSRRRILAAVIVGLLAVAVLVIGRGAQVAPSGAPSVTLDGRALGSGTREVPHRPALGLLLPPGSRASDFSVTLDGRPAVVLATGGRAARLEVGELAQGSHHRLEVWHGSPGAAPRGAVDVDFQVADALQLAASWLSTPLQATVQVSASRELVDASMVETALGHAGARVRRDERGIEGRWPAGRTPAFTLPAGLRATNGAFLPADFSSALGSPEAGPMSKVDLSAPPGPAPSGLRLRAYFVSGPAARASLAAHAAKISVLSPTFYSANSDGTLAPAVDEQGLALARAAGVVIEPLVTNRDFSAAVARDLFRNGSAVETLGAALVAEARNRGYRGYQLDFEGLNFGDRAALSAFSSQLSRRLQGAGLEYSVAVVPTKDAQGGGLAQLLGHSGVYDFAQLSRDASSMSVMAYDQHTGATAPGPVAGLDWVGQVTEASTSGLDHRHIYMGVPLYYRDWPLHGPSRAGAYTDLLAAAAGHDGTISWDFGSQTPYVRYRDGGEEHVAWTENGASLRAKLQLAKRMGFGGIAAWRIGLEDPAFWDLW